jgi:NADH dehydrogenase
MILVAGATGVLGSEIVRQLRARGEQVRALVRATSAPEKLARLQGQGVETVQGNVRDRRSLDRACQGADVVISTVSITFSAQPDDSIDGTDGAGNVALVDAAKAAGVKQFIFVSFDTTAAPDAPLVRAKRSVQDRLIESGLAYTILQPSLFMESWLSPMLFADPAAGTAKRYGDGVRVVSYVAMRDVAELAVRCVRNPSAYNRTIRFGSEEMSQNDALRVFEEVFAKPFNVTEMPEPALDAQWQAATDPMGKSFAALMLGIARGMIRGTPPAATEFPIAWTTVRQWVGRRRSG